MCAYLFDDLLNESSFIESCEGSTHCVNPLSSVSESGGAARQWSAEDESLYYIVSPKDVVLARPRYLLRRH